MRPAESWQLFAGVNADSHVEGNSHSSVWGDLLPHLNSDLSMVRGANNRDLYKRFGWPRWFAGQVTGVLFGSAVIRGQPPLSWSGDAQLDMI